MRGRCRTSRGTSADTPPPRISSGYVSSRTQLKGSSGGYGFAEIMGTAAAIETSALERDVATVDRLVQTLLELCERASAGAELENVPA
jgi:hypothetical protein